MAEIIALAVADIHLSHNPPVARSAEPDWYEAMGRRLDQLRDLQRENGGVPILCAGDVFDRWNSPPELINFAIKRLPNMYALPGQHDLPYHSLADIERSAFWTLVEEGTIEYVGEGTVDIGGKFRLTGFPWGVEVVPKIGKVISEGFLSIALVHSFVWESGYEYPGASICQHVESYRKRLTGFDVAIFGDNHSRFFVKVGDCRLINCGCLIPRKRDERYHLPAVELIYDDGNTGYKPLDTSEDKWLTGQVTEEWADLQERREELQFYLDELGDLEADSLDFREAVRRYVSDSSGLSRGVKQVLLELIGG